MDFEALKSPDCYTPLPRPTASCATQSCLEKSGEGASCVPSAGSTATCTLNAAEGGCDATYPAAGTCTALTVADTCSGAGCVWKPPDPTQPEVLVRRGAPPLARCLRLSAGRGRAPLLTDVDTGCSEPFRGKGHPVLYSGRGQGWGANRPGGSTDNCVRGRFLHKI